MAGSTGPTDPRRPFDAKEVFIAPPLAGDGLDDDFREPPRWPKVVGVISIVWGALGLCCNVLSGAWSILGGQMMGAAASNMSGGMPPAITNPPPIMIALAGVGVLWSLLLIVAGAVTASRKPAGRPLHIAYAVGGIILVVIGTYLQLKMQNDIAAWVAANPDSDFAKSQAASPPILQYLGMALGLLLGFGWPLFCLVWFGFVKRKPEQMTGGIEEPAA